MSVTIAVLSQKGGTGKTTTVRSLADVLERVGLDVLSIDADPQGNLSDYFDVDPEAQPTLGEVLAGQARAVDAVHGPVIPANLGLAEAELVLAGKIGREVTLRNALRDVKRRHDVILIDCPPTLGLLTVNALVASTHALLSTQAQHFSLQGVEQALQIFDLARDTLNPELELLGVLLNIANMRTRHARQTLEALEERFPGKVFDTVIRQSIAYAESAERARPILDYRPERGADYIDLAARGPDAARDGRPRPPASTRSGGTRCRRACSRRPASRRSRRRLGPAHPGDGPDRGRTTAAPPPARSATPIPVALAGDQVARAPRRSG